MPGEYGDEFGCWSFDRLNGEGYVAETSQTSSNNGYAAIYGYKGTDKQSRLTLHAFNQETMPKTVMLSFSMLTGGGDGATFGIEAVFDNELKEIMKLVINNGRAESDISGVTFMPDLNKWNRYMIAFDTEKDTYTVYLNSKTVFSGEIENAQVLQSVNFVFKSENDEDRYFLDDTALIY